MKRNEDLIVSEHSPHFSVEHFELYSKYQSTRHTDGSMDHKDRNAYEDFLVNSPIRTRFFEFRISNGPREGELLAVAVSDVIDDGLSAVYTYFDPDEARRGLGVYAILWQIQHSTVMKLDYVYLGYWIKDCQKMSYKQNFHPLQGWRDGAWRPLRLN